MKTSISLRTRSGFRPAEFPLDDELKAAFAQAANIASPRFLREEIGSVGENTWVGELLVTIGGPTALIAILKYSSQVLIAWVKRKQTRSIEIESSGLKINLRGETSPAELDGFIRSLQNLKRE